MNEVKDIKIWEYERQHRLQSFDELLDTIQSIRSKEKTLWKEIYDNAISDRQKADFVYSKMIIELSMKKGDEVLPHYNLSAKLLSDLLTRMEKATAQLIKLAEMVQLAKSNQDEEDQSNLLEQFESLKEGTG